MTGWCARPGPLRRPGLMTAAILAVALGWSGMARRDALPPPPEGAAIGALAPAVKLLGASGEVALPEALRGRPTIIMLFRGSWCSYCRSELRRLAVALEREPARDVLVLGVSADPPEALAQLERTLPLPFALRSDRGGHLAAMCRFAMHCVLLFDPQATLRWAGYAETWHAPVPYEAVVRAARRLR